MYRRVITGQTHAKPSSGAVDSTKSHFQPNVGITIRAKRTSKHAPSAQKHYIKIDKRNKLLIV